MTRQNFGIGSAANDGNGDTLRTAGTKINANFREIYTFLADSNNLSTQISLENDAVVFEGSTANDFEIRLKAKDATADRDIILPNVSGNLVLDSATQTLTNKTLTTPVISSISNGGTITIPSGADTLVARTSTDTLTNKTLTSPTTYRPIIQQSINDSSGNELINLVRTVSAVNEITITNKATGGHPSIATTGDDADVNLSLLSKGKGSVAISKAAFTSDEFDSNGHNGGQADSSSSLIICNSGTPLAVALGPGTTVGEFKLFTNKGVGLATITPAPFANGNTIRLPQNTATQCIWDGTNWFMLSGNDSANSIIIS